MFQEFLFDLRVARKRSGLTQADCGHLLGASNNTISQIELGARLPTIREMCILSLIYERSFESFYRVMLKEARKTLSTRLISLPSHPAENQRRRRTLNRLAKIVTTETTPWQ